MKIIVAKKKRKKEEEKKKIVIVKNNIAIHIAGKVSRYIDASMNRATPTNLLNTSKWVDEFVIESVGFFIVNNQVNLLSNINYCQATGLENN